MDIKKILASGIPAGVVIFILGNYIFYAASGTSVSLSLVNLLLVNLVIGVIVAAAYDRLNKFAKSEASRGWTRGGKFGLWLGVVFGLISLLSGYMSTAVLSSALFAGFIGNVLSYGFAGTLIGELYARF